MKLKKLKIDSYLHLQDLEFDFTYPEGHKKAGLPLEKICFIGQSATGKTTLLEIISNIISYLLKAKTIGNSIDEISFDSTGKFKNGSLKLSFDGKDLDYNKDLINYNNFKYDFIHCTGGVVGKLLSNPKSINKLLFFDSNYVSNENIKYFNTNPLEIVFEKREFNYQHLDEFIFNENISEVYLVKLLESFLDFRQKYDTIVRELLKKGLISDLDKFNKEFQKWQKDNPNPLDEFSAKFDKLLNKLNLEIDKVSVEYPIPFKNKLNDEIIPISGLSTGTKALLLYMLPLFQIDTSQSIVLIDEPERSLYPDVQMELMDFYRQVSPDAQFIIATHSPFIAASFEPEERFILYFEDNKVKVKRGNSPIGDDPNDILANDFVINYINRYGQKAFDEYKELKQKIHFEDDEKKKKEISKKLEVLGEKYNF
jgi:predicted ATP-dependent endonuclease of OLD family